MFVSNQDIKPRIESILSDILSVKYDAKITIKFVKKEEKKKYGNGNSTRGFQEESVLDR